MRTVTLASVRTYARRYVAAFVAVVIATGFIVAINGLAAAARDGADESVSQHYTGVDAVAKDLDGTADADRLREAAAGDPDVTGAAINWRGWTGVTLTRGPQPVSVGSVAHDPALRWQRLASGRLPSTNDEIAVSTSRATKDRIRRGDSLVLDVGDRDRTFTVTGTIDDQDGPLRSVLYLPERAFAQLDSVADPVDVVIATAGDAPGVTARLQSAVPGSEVLTGEEYVQEIRLQATRGIDIFQKLILIFAGISLFVGALVIANTFTILLAQRARDLALLRCVGAVRGQIARSVVAEGLLTGAVGSVTGVGLGYLVARGGAAAVESLSPTTPMGTPTLTVTAVAVPIVLGVAVTVIASYLPARRAGAQSPLGALQPHGAVELRTRAGAARLAAAVLFLLVGALGLVVGVQGSLPVGMLGGMTSFVGVLLLTPVLVPAAIRWCGPVARRLGVPGRLAHSNSLRNPRRTAATSTALLIGVTLITSVVVGASSISNKVNTSLDNNHPLDLVASAPQGRLPGGVPQQLADVDGVSAAVVVEGSAARVDHERATVLGVQANALDLVRGSRWLRGLRADQIVIPAASDDYPDARAGDTVILQVGERMRELSVVFGAGLGDSAIVRAETLAELGARTTPRAVWIRAADGASSADVTSDVTGVVKGADLDLVGGLPERAEILKILGIVVAVTVGLLAVAVLIALIGVGNTLSLSVLERVRENALLRALGLERSGLRMMLAVESLLMAGVSAALGIGLGALYAWCGVKTVGDDIFESAPSLTVPWAQVGVIFLVAAAAGLAASVLPARRAARIAPAAGLVAD